MEASGRWIRGLGGRGTRLLLLLHPAVPLEGRATAVGQIRTVAALVQLRASTTLAWIYRSLTGSGLATGMLWVTPAGAAAVAQPQDRQEGRVTTEAPGRCCPPKARSPHQGPLWLQPAAWCPGPRPPLTLTTRA